MQPLQALVGVRRPRSARLRVNGQLHAHVWPGLVVLAAWLMLIAEPLTALKLKIYVYNMSGHALDCADLQGKQWQSQSCM